ncbi:ABC transporter permease [Rhizomicrobium electricum]|jgi:ABC-2 type transport system permease protein|uniref:Transport permease protein n=1 Tax=Rhizomicrobium electricum TaxID=480070 RepID=A0ABN1E4H8_9PROT|nr:ABC transporter permease [Rhizomicrobium electricum]NIJ47601.1 ABC-2 type transport system permease protein [Rhizomicrobium electricum]
MENVIGHVNWIGLWTIIRREMQRLLRVPIQAFVAPWLSALMFIFIFGYVVGPRIATIGGHKYLQFVLPGILMMNVVNAAFLQATSQVYFQRFMKFVEEALVAPLSYVEMIVGTLAAVVFRTAATAVGILIIAAVFGGVQVVSVVEFMFWVVIVSGIFGLLGIVIGLWAKSFEQLSALNIFFITPLSFVGGVFNTVEMLPPFLRWLAWGNPFFYFINGLRHSMIGFNEAPEPLGALLSLAMLAILSVWVWRLFSVGYGLRE